MKNIKSALLASVALAFPIAFESGKAGWKMDGDKIALDANGNPIYLDSAGNEMSVAHDTIARLNAEAKSHREAKETAEKALKKFEGITDPAAAVAALDTVSKLDAKKLIDAGEVDKVKEAIKGEFTQQLTEKDTALKDLQSRYDASQINGIFANSEFLRNRIAVPRDMVEASLRGNFRLEDGKPVAYDRAGNRLMSRKKVGEYAEPDEALELLIETHPQKDSILKAPDAGGSGNNGGGGQRGGGRSILRADFEKLAPAQQAATAAQATKGEITISD